MLTKKQLDKYQGCEMFAETWITPGSTHEQAWSACVDGVMAQMEDDGIPERRRRQYAEDIVNEWGDLSREPEDD